MIREERTEISYANKKKAAKPTFGKEEICIKIFIQQSDTEEKRLEELSAYHPTGKYIFASFGKMNMRNARSNWVKFISYSARPNHIWPQRAWNRLLFATHSHSLAAVFPLLFCQFYIFRRAKRKEKKRLQAKSSVDM